MNHDMLARLYESIDGDEELGCLLEEALSLPSTNQLEDDLDVERKAYRRFWAACNACDMDGRMGCHAVEQMVERGHGFDESRRAVFRCMLENAGRWDEDWEWLMGERSIFRKLENDFDNRMNGVEGGDE